MGIVCIVDHGDNQISFLLLKDEMNIIEVSKSEVLNLVYDGKVDGIDLVNGGFVGVGGFDLSKVPVYSEDNSINLTDFERYKNFRLKEDLLGQHSFDVHVISDNNIRLVECCNKEDADTLVIPSFISRINEEAFNNCEYTNIVIHNSPYKLLDLGGAFACMRSNTLKISIDYPLNVINMREAFLIDNNLRLLDISALNTRNVRNISSMFEDCTSLKHINFGEFDTTNVVDMSRLFSSCYEVDNLDLSKWNTSKLRDIESLFFECKSLQDLRLENLNTRLVEKMSYMFCGCSNLRRLDLSSFDTSNVSDMRAMFKDCTSLDYLDISNFNIGDDTNTSLILAGCSSLEHLKLPNHGIDTSRVRF